MLYVQRQHLLLCIHIGCIHSLSSVCDTTLLTKNPNFAECYELKCTLESNISGQAVFLAVDRLRSFIYSKKTNCGQLRMPGLLGDKKIWHDCGNWLGR